MNRSWSGWVDRVALGLLLLDCGAAPAQFHHRAKVAPVAPPASLTFMKRDGSCVVGPIVKIEPKVVTVRAQAGPTTIARRDLLQVSEGDSLVFSARSSWADVEAEHLRQREGLTVKLRNGKLITESRPRASLSGAPSARRSCLCRFGGKPRLTASRIHPSAIGGSRNPKAASTISAIPSVVSSS